MENNKPKKNNIFTRLVNVINKVVPASKSKKEPISTRFDIFVRLVNKKHESYSSVKKAAELCDEAIVLSKRRIGAINRANLLAGKMAELECYENLTDQEIDEFKNLIERFVSLNKDRNALRFQIAGFDKSLVEMGDLEEDAKFILKSMEDSERQRKILRHDTALLQGEKSELEHEYLQMQNAGEFVRKLSIGLLAAFGFMAVFLGFWIFNGSANLFIPTAILCFSLIILTMFLGIFRQRIRAEIRLNLLKQQKCVELINKKNVVYAYHLNFLKFVYKKYNVRSSDKLKKNLSDFNDYKTITRRYDSIKSAMYQTERQIEGFLREKNIANALITIEKFAKTVDLEDKRKVYNNYATELARLEKLLEGLDSLLEGIWGELTLLEDLDKTDDKLIAHIIRQYNQEVENIVKINTPSEGSDDDDTEEAEARDMNDVSDMDLWYQNVN
ncbi:MAG: hypothetical protein FWE24_05275 [Defluviitaleaceae bacterium]|nr:hypothetical protein [Defluviitaleaceae bacterium]